MMDYSKWRGPEPPAAVPFESWESWTYRHILQEVRSLREALAESVEQSRRIMRESARPGGRRPRVRELHTLVGDPDFRHLGP